MKTTERGAFTHYKLSTSLKATLGLENTYLRINQDRLVSAMEKANARLTEYREENEQLAKYVLVLRDLLRLYRDKMDDDP